MLRLLCQRLLQLPLIIASILFISLTLVWYLPGDPFQQDGGKQVSAEVLMALKRQYHMDEGPLVFMWHYASNAVHGDFGQSTANQPHSVAKLIADGLPVSAGLGLSALAIGVLLGTCAGAIGALRPKSSLDFSASILTLIGISLPSFVSGAILLVIGTSLFGLPIGGWNGPLSMLLPALTLSLPTAAYVTRLIRLGLADAMHSDFVRTARAKGLSNTQVVWNHAMKVAFLPVLSFLGPAAAANMTGSFVIEKLFNIPGMGTTFVKAVQNKDIFLILGVVMVFSTLLVLFNLLVDLAYAWIDPRIKL